MDTVRLICITYQQEEQGEDMVKYGLAILAGFSAGFALKLALPHVVGTVSLLVGLTVSAGLLSLVEATIEARRR